MGSWVLGVWLPITDQVVLTRTQSLELLTLAGKLQMTSSCRKANSKGYMCLFL